MALRHGGDALAAHLLGSQPSNRFAVDGDHAGMRRQGARERQHQTALAGAIGAEKRRDAPGRDFEIDAVDDLAAAPHHAQPRD